MKRSLSLKREPVADLTSAELTAVVGAALPSTPVTDCLLFSYPCFTSGHTCINCEK